MRFFLSTAVVLATAAGVAAHVAAPGHGPRDGRMELVASVKHVVSVTSSPVTGLYPGAPAKPLTLRIKNMYAYRIRVTSVTAKVGAATNRPGCTGTPQNLAVPPKTSPIRISPRQTANVVMTVVMPKTVANACQGATFTITFAAHAVRG
jgi:hypothetical protein